MAVITQVNCPFCGWHQIKDTSKGTAQVWDEDEVLRRLAYHLNSSHYPAILKLREVICGTES